MRYALSCAVIAGLPALATTVTTTYSQWDSSTFINGTPTVLDFSSPGGSWDNSAGLSTGGFVFTGPDGGGYILTAQRLAVGQQNIFRLVWRSGRSGGYQWEFHDRKQYSSMDLCSGCKWQYGTNR